ncbi:MAG: UDP-N-acetylglucosamine 2-epimerase [Marinilabiliales bacterium]|nr:UDP-N-acetylglucosamine 2-epimerase [Marinilabiliales bacterium]
MLLSSMPDFQTNQLTMIVPPVSFLEMILLEKKACMIITDSGGVQKESHFFSTSVHCTQERDGVGRTCQERNGEACRCRSSEDH